MNHMPVSRRRAVSTTTTSNANGVDAPRGPRAADEVELIARELESRENPVIRVLRDRPMVTFCH